MQTMICIRVPLRKENVRVVKWVRALSITLVASVQSPAVCQSMFAVAYIHLSISNNCETGIGLANSLRTSFIIFQLKCNDATRNVATRGRITHY